MSALAEGRGAAAVTLLGGSVVVVVQRPAAFEPAADRRVERIVGRVAAGEQRIAAGGGDLDRVEQGGLARHLGVDHVVMEHHLAVRQRPIGSPFSRMLEISMMPGRRLE